MGSVSWVGRLDEDGSVERMPPPGPAVADIGEAVVSLHYEYGPELLPPPPFDDRGMWRYLGLLPLEGPVDFPLPVGGTPLVGPPPLRRALGVPELYLKDESRGPSGSNKDRASALVVEQARRAGATTVTAASTGNVATATAIAAAAVGLRAVIFVPADTSPAKLAPMLLAGAVVIKVAAGYGRAFELSRLCAREFGWHDRNTGVNPSTLEAKKTVALEVWEQLGREVPDVVVVPVGDGVTLAAAAKGFRELVACGGARRMPRVVGVQAEGCQPVRRALAGQPAGEGPPRTIADGIAVAAPVAARMVLQAVRDTRGTMLAVSDQEMLAAMRLLAAAGGLLAEPAGAAATAGLLQALEAGDVGRGERVVVWVTGTALKTPQWMRPAAEAFEVEASLEEVTRVIDAACM